MSLIIPIIVGKGAFKLSTKRVGRQVTKNMSHEKSVWWSIKSLRVNMTLEMRSLLSDTKNIYLSRRRHENIFKMFSKSNCYNITAPT